MELSKCSSTSALGGQNVAALEMFSANGEDRRSPTSPPALSESAEAGNSGGRDAGHGAAIASNKKEQPYSAVCEALFSVEDDALQLVPQQQQHQTVKDFESNTASDDNNDFDHIGDENNDDDDDDRIDDDEDLVRNDLLDGSLEDNDCGTREGVCGVCSEAYTQPPRVLNCLHVFCEACLGKQQRPLSSSPNHGQVTNGVIGCPKCHTETECTQGLKSLPLDYVLINRLDAEAIRRRTVICTSCKSEVGSEFFCTFIFRTCPRQNLVSISIVHVSQRITDLYN